MAVRSQAVLTTPGAGFRPLDISNEILNIRPAQSTLLTLLMALKKVNVDSREYRVNEQDVDPGYVTTTAMSAGSSTITVSTDDVKFVRIGQNVRLDHDSVYLVEAVNYTTGVITLDAITGLAASGDLLVLGSAASEELSDRPTVISRVPGQHTNYVETLRDAYGQSRWVETERYYGGARQHMNREMCLWEHKRSIDRGLWFNTGTETTQGGQKLFKTSGIFASIQRSLDARVHEFASGNVTWASMRSNITSDTRFTPSPNLWLFVSRLGLEIIETVIRDSAVPVHFAEAATIKITKLGMGGKTLNIMVVDAFEADTDLEKCMVLIDPAYLEIVTTRNQTSKQRQWMLERKFDGNDATGSDGTIGEVLTDFGLRLNNDKAHAIWWNAAQAA